MPKWYEILFLSIHLRFQDIFLQKFHFIIDIKPFYWEIQMGNNSSLGRKLTFECADLNFLNQLIYFIICWHILEKGTNWKASSNHSSTQSFQLFAFYLPLEKIHCKPIPVMKTGFSLCTFSHREKPVSISWDPCNENRIFPVGNTTQGKPCFHYRDGFAVNLFLEVLMSYKLEQLKFKFKKKYWDWVTGRKSLKNCFSFQVQVTLLIAIMAYW